MGNCLRCMAWCIPTIPLEWPWLRLNRVQWDKASFCRIRKTSWDILRHLKTLFTFGCTVVPCVSILPIQAGKEHRHVFDMPNMCSKHVLHVFSTTWMWKWCEAEKSSLGFWHVTEPMGFSDFLCVPLVFVDLSDFGDEAHPADSATILPSCLGRPAWKTTCWMRCCSRRSSPAIIRRSARSSCGARRPPNVFNDLLAVFLGYPLVN